MFRFRARRARSGAAVRVIEVRAAEVFDHSRGVLDLEDIEPVHDMRVATRRLRAAMEVFEPCFPTRRYRHALKRLKALADALGERRDRDVAIEFLNGFADDSAPPTGGTGRGPDRRAAEEQRANDDLAPLSR